MSNIIPMNYDDRSFPFASDCWFNATIAAKHHGRKVTEWLRLPSTKEYMAELCQELGIEGFNFKGGIFPPLVRIEKGRYGGTWLHPSFDVTMEMLCGDNSTSAAIRLINVLEEAGFDVSAPKAEIVAMRKHLGNVEYGMKAIADACRRAGNKTISFRGGKAEYVIG